MTGAEVFMAATAAFNLGCLAVVVAVNAGTRRTLRRIEALEALDEAEREQVQRKEVRV